jgi:hypothetical protein
MGNYKIFYTLLGQPATQMFILGIVWRELTFCFFWN